MRDSPALLLQLAVCLVAQLKGITRKKATPLVYSRRHCQLVWGYTLPFLPLLIFFFIPVCRKKTASVCQLTLNAAMKPGLTKVFLSVAPGITSPQILYLIIHGADFECYCQA